MDPSQFGFVARRGSKPAAALVPYACSYCSSCGSPAFLCSLDAKHAFNTISHFILFVKSAEALPDHCWWLLFGWYSSMSVWIKSNHQVSSLIQDQRATRQGGLDSSMFIFNLLIQGCRFHTFCCATPTGLQLLIGSTVEQIALSAQKAFYSLQSAGLHCGFRSPGGIQSSWASSACWSWEILSC